MRPPLHLRFIPVLLIALLPCFAPVACQAGARAAETGHARYVGEDTDSIRVRVDSLRALGSYDTALATAQVLLGKLDADTRSRPYQIEDAKRLIGTLQSVLALPDSSRKKLAQADRLYLEGEESVARQDIGTGEPAARRSLEIRSEILGSGSLDAARSMNSLAGLLRTRGNLAEAERLYLQSLEIRRKLLGDEHPDVAGARADYALLLRTRGDLAGAETYSRQALSVLRKALGAEHPNVASCLHNLANVLRSRGETAEAEPLYREALTMRRRFFGEENLDVASSLGALASALRDEGDYAAAEPLMRQALVIRRKILGERHRRVAVGMNELALLLAYRGDYAGAEPLFKESLEIMEASGPSPDLAVCLNNAGVYNLNRKKYDAAEPLLRQSLEMTKKLLGPANPAVARDLSNLASILRGRGDHAGADSLYRESLAMFEKFLGQEHPEVASTMFNLASLLVARGEYATADSLYRESLEIRRTVLGKDHPEVVNSLVSLADLMQARGDPAAAETLFEEAAATFESARLRAGTGVSRTTFVKASPYSSLAGVRLTLGKMDAAWPAAERSLGRSLSDLLLAADGRRLSVVEKVREDSLLKALRDGESQLAVFAKAARRDSTEESRRKAGEARTSLLETEVRWAEYRRLIASKYEVTEGQTFDLSRVQNSLRPRQAIVGWLDLPEPTPGKGARSWGYVVRPKGPVRWARLDPESVENMRFSKRLRAWVERLRTRPAGEHQGGAPSLPKIYRIEVSRRPISTETDEDRASRLGGERLVPLLPHLSGIDELVIIPSGEMLGIPIEALEIDGGRVGDRFAVSYVPSATIFAWLREKGIERQRAGASPSKEPDCLALGDPQFQPRELTELRRPVPVAEASAGSELRTRSVTGDSAGGLRPEGTESTGVADQGGPAEDDLLLRALAGDRLALSAAPPLPSTRDEATAIASLFGGGSRLLLGVDASEQQLVRMASSGELARFQTIHLATHALVDDEHPERSALILSQVDLPDPYEAALEGKRIYDGMLDAKEIVREWKLDADLVTLSACETALGRPVAGEGYVGLADAFLQAGARTLLVSLWRVEDRSTGMLMKRFYENWRGGYAGTRESVGGRKSVPGAPMTKADALREAKRWVREWRDTDGKRPFAHPFYWAGFILIGEA